MSDQYLRKVGLTVLAQAQGPQQPIPGPVQPGSLGGSGLDLSTFRIKFKTSQFDYETPNHATIRIYNLSDETAKSVEKEFSEVVLQAGYKEPGAYGVIFRGTIKMVRRGRENQTDTYLDILAADGDRPYNFATVNNTYDAGKTKAAEQAGEVAKAMGIPIGYSADLPPGALSRGKVQYGLARDVMRKLAQSTGTTWSIQEGKIVIIPLTGYRSGEAVVINSQTGMIGLPEQTEGGIRVRALLNPKIRIGGLLQIDNKSIQRAFLSGTNLFAPGRLEDSLASKLLPKTTDDGFYRVFVAEFEGDNRGGSSSPWYVNMTCLSVDRSAAPDQSVSVSGGAVEPSAA